MRRSIKVLCAALTLALAWPMLARATEPEAPESTPVAAPLRALFGVQSRPTPESAPEPTPGYEPAATLEPAVTPRPDGSIPGERGLRLTGEAPVAGIGRPRTPSRVESGMSIAPLYQSHYRTVLCYYDGYPRRVHSSGCGAVCLSMAAAYLTGDCEQSPETLFLWALENGLYDGNGLGHEQMSAIAKYAGLSGKWIKKDAQKVIEALEANHPVIMHVGPGIFTKNGHYILLRGLNKAGEVLVNDPASRIRTHTSYPMEVMMKQCRTDTPFMILSVQ